MYFWIFVFCVYNFIFSVLPFGVINDNNKKIESRLLTYGPKFDRESLYEPVKFETLQPYFGQQILILDRPYIGLFGPSWSELSP